MENQPTPHTANEDAPNAAKPGDAALERARIRAKHSSSFPGLVYGIGMSSVLGESGKADAQAYAKDVIARMEPRDALEEMLIAQLLFTHARITRLTYLANQQDSFKNIATINEYADRATNTYRRHMLALAEYRKPPRQGDTIAFVHQANIANQQLVQNGGAHHGNATNEQGCRSKPADTRSSAAGPPPLPADTNGIGGPAISRPACEAVDAIQRPPNA